MAGARLVRTILFHHSMVVGGRRGKVEGRCIGREGVKKRKGSQRRRERHRERLRGLSTHFWPNGLSSPRQCMNLCMSGALRTRLLLGSSFHLVTHMSHRGDPRESTGPQLTVKSLCSCFSPKMKWVYNRSGHHPFAEGKIAFIQNIAMKATHYLFHRRIGAPRVTR